MERDNNRLDELYRKIFRRIAVTEIVLALAAGFILIVVLTILKISL